MVDLHAAPFHLSDDDIAWVDETFAAMSDEEKIGQLFVNMGASRDEDYLVGMLESYHIGAVRYRPGPAAEVLEQNRILQTRSAIPLLIAANAEAGGNGACTDGTYVGNAIKIAATGDDRYAYELGRIAGEEARAVGCNVSFGPVVDLLLNWRNPIIATRAFSSDPDRVLACARAYIRGLAESGVLATAKHFPGDGVDERDHHLSRSVNTMTCSEWDDTFGRIYRGLIDDGLPMIMAGHLMLPAYQRHFRPGVPDRELRPATLSSELLTDLLRGQLGFNGVIVTDASHMVGFSGAMARRDLVPAAIAAGCDLFLFFNDPDEDFGWMLEGYRSGVISEERLTDAVRRILGLKARLGLHRTPRTEIVPAPEEATARIATSDNATVAEEVAAASLTLVKDLAPEVWPVTPERYRRILVVPSSGPSSPIAAAFVGPDGLTHPAAAVVELLREEGFDATLHESMVDRLMKMPESERGQAVRDLYSGKTPISALTDAYDLVLVVSRVEGMMQTVARAAWPMTKGTVDIPWYVHELPTIVCSTASPFALADVPQVATYINAYDDKPVTLRALVDKLLGRADFVGVSPVDAHCGLADTTF